MPFEKHVLRQDLNIWRESVTECAWEIPASRRGSTLTSDPHYGECIPGGVKPLAAQSTRAWENCTAPAESGLVWALSAHSLTAWALGSLQINLFFVHLVSLYWGSLKKINKRLFRICNSKHLKKTQRREKSHWSTKYSRDSVANVWRDEKCN